MNEQVHTPGPWSWHYDAEYNKGYIYTPEHKKVWDGRTRSMTEVIDEQRIATINPDWCHASEIVAATDHCQPHWRQVEANGRLMAAAPLMLEALEAVPEDERTAVMRAAIAAAKGGA